MLTQPQENIFMTNIQSKNNYDNDRDLLLLEFLFSILLLAYVLTVQQNPLLQLMKPLRLPYEKVG